LTTLVNPMRGKRLKRAKTAIACAAVLLQLHLVLVLEIHRHSLDPANVSGSQRHALGRVTPTSDSNPLDCPSCQIARHGAVQPAAFSTVFAILSETAKVHQVLPIRPLSPGLFVSPGRAPPLS